MKKSQYQKYLRELSKLFSKASLEEEVSWLGKLEEKLSSLSDEYFTEKKSRELIVPEELKQNEEAIGLFTDGACRGNPGAGAWAALGQNAKGDILFEASGLEVMTTNNRMEIQAVISALKEIKLASESMNKNIFHLPVLVYSDSRYVIDGITKWVPGWKNLGWKKADKKEPENIVYWKELDEIVGAFHNINFIWVKGHAGHPQNERCDELCNQALDEAGY